MKATLTVRHDYLTLRVTDGKQRLNLTTARSRETASGALTDPRGLHAALAAFARYLKTKEPRGTRMESLRVIAEASATIEQFIGSMAAATPTTV